MMLTVILTLSSMDTVSESAITCTLKPVSKLETSPTSILISSEKDNGTSFALVTVIFTLCMPSSTGR